MRVLRLIILCSMVLLPGINVSAQNKTPMRVEITCQEDTRPFELISLGNNGLLLFYRTNSPAAKDHIAWEFADYSINLKLIWTKSIEIPSEFEFRQCVKNQDRIVMLLQNTAGKSKGDKLCFVIIDMSKPSFKTIIDDFPLKANVKRLQMTDSLVFVGFNSTDKQAGFLIKNIITGNIRQILPENNQKSWLDDISVDSSDQKIYCLYEFFPERKHSIFRIRQFDFSGTLRDSLPDLDFSSTGQSVNSVLFEKFNKGNYLLMGSYSNQSEKTFNEASERLEESTGFFSCQIKNGIINSKNFYNFLSFKNFYNKIRGNQAILESGTRKNKETSSDYRLLFHPLINKDGEFYLISEAYYPEYHTVTNWSYDYYGHMVPNYYTVFDGYRYNNTLIAGLDSTGTLKWDNSFEINNILTLKLVNRLNIMFDNNEMILAYNYNGKIGSRIFKKSIIASNIEYSGIDLLYNSDRLLSDDESNMNYWYDNYFITYGYQKIKNTTRAPSTRYVFYMNKIAYR